MRINGENPDKIGVFMGYIYFVALFCERLPKRYISEVKLPKRYIVDSIAHVYCGFSAAFIAPAACILTTRFGSFSEMKIRFSK